MNQGEKIQLLIVGATGQLGQLIAKHCFNQPSLQVNILVRNPDKNKELCQKVVDLGGKVIIGDATKPETLKDSTIGIHTIISSLIGDDSTVLEGQRALLRDAVKNGVKRFVASDFSCDYRQLQISEHPMLGQRIQFRQDIAQTNVKGIHIFNGIFMETFWRGMAYKSKEGEMILTGLGDCHIPIDITTYEDTARFVAAVVSDRQSAGDYEIIGQMISLSQIQEIYKRLKGKPCEVRIEGSVQDFINLRDSHPTKQGWPYLKYCYLIPMFDGRGKLHNAQNEKFGIQTTQVEQFLQNRQDL